MTMLRMRSIRGLGQTSTLLAVGPAITAAGGSAQAGTLSPEAIRVMATSLQPVQTAAQVVSSGSAPTPPSGGGGAPADGVAPASTPETSRQCACLADALGRAAMEQGMSLPGDAVAQFAVSCTANPDAAMQMASQGGINVDQCKPWYMRKTTWIAGGLVALLGVGAFVAMR